MKSKKKHLAAIWLFVGVLLVGFTVLPGCETSQPRGHEVSTKGKQDTDGQKWTCPMHPQIVTVKADKCSICGMDLVSQETARKREAAQKPDAVITSEPTKEIGRQAVQTNCPIMDTMAIDKSVYTEHQGKKVYFCCAGCINTFKENPEKYLSKLPQFNL